MVLCKRWKKRKFTWSGQRGLGRAEWTIESSDRSGSLQSGQDGSQTKRFCEPYKKNKTVNNVFAAHTAAQWPLLSLTEFLHILLLFAHPSWTKQRGKHCDRSRPSYSNQKIKVLFSPSCPHLETSATHLISHCHIANSYDWSRHTIRFRAGKNLIVWLFIVFFISAYNFNPQ